MTRKKIKIPIYQGTLDIAIFDNYEKSEYQFDGDFEPSYYDFAGYSIMNNKYYLVIINKIHNKDEITTIGTIAHEALHVTNKIMRDCGIEIDLSNDEVQAYLLSYITEQIYKIYKSHK